MTLRASRKSQSNRVALVLGTALLCAASAADASPWTLPEGEAVLTISTDVQFASDEFLIGGDRAAFPLDGEYLSFNLRPGLRFGLSDRTEIGFQLALSYISYESDEAYFEPAPTDTLTLPEVRDGILSFDRSTAGLGDIVGYVRHRVTEPGRVAIAFELQLKMPTGYTPLTDAFDGNADAQEDGRGLVDDVTLGDGQLDVTGQILLGIAPPGGWFIRLDAGFRGRLFGPGQQLVGAFKVGRQIVDGWVPYLFVDGQWSFTEGEVVGQVPNAIDADIPAREFERDNLVLRDLRLDRTIIRPGIGSIFRLGDREVDLSYALIVFGENVAQTHVISLGTTFSL